MIYRKSLHSTADVAQWYDRKYIDMKGCWQTPVEELDRHLDDFGLTGGDLRVLDIGCGDGSLVKRAASRGYFSYGIEISEEAITRSEGQKIYKHDICSGPVTLPIPAADRIISLGSLEHVIDIDAALGNIRISLRPYGRWYIFIPNELWKHNDQPNERTATDAEWTALFKKHGLIVESSKRWNDSTAFQGSVFKSLTVEIASVLCGGDGPKLAFNFNGLNEDGFKVDTHTERVCFIDPSIGSGMGNIHCRWYDNRANLVTPCQAYQSLLDQTQADILIYAHDDLTINDPSWLSRVMEIFDNNPDCVVVGLGGSTSLGRPNLYKRPYRIEDMARGGYVSNQIDYETHGGHLTGDMRVAVVDAFFMAIRADFLRGIGGWPVDRISHHCIDLFICCMAARHGKTVWATGCECHHQGGGTSVKPIYTEKAKWLQGGTLPLDHILPHKFLYEEFRDCLPLRV